MIFVAFLRHRFRRIFFFARHRYKTKIFLFAISIDRNKIQQTYTQSFDKEKLFKNWYMFSYQKFKTEYMCMVLLRGISCGWSYILIIGRYNDSWENFVCFANFSQYFLSRKLCLFIGFWLFGDFCLWKISLFFGILNRIWCQRESFLKWRYGSFLNRLFWRLFKGISASETVQISLQDRGSEKVQFFCSLNA